MNEGTVKLLSKDRCNTHLTFPTDWDVVAVFDIDNY